MSKSINPKPAGIAGATASQSKSLLKTLDFDRRFIDVLIEVAVSSGCQGAGRIFVVPSVMLGG
jgi:hypothetical protein